MLRVAEQVVAEVVERALRQHSRLRPAGKRIYEFLTGHDRALHRAARRGEWQEPAAHLHLLDERSTRLLQRHDRSAIEGRFVGQVTLQVAGPFVFVFAGRAPRRRGVRRGSARSLRSTAARCVRSPHRWRAPPGRARAGRRQERHREPARRGAWQARAPRAQVRDLGVVSRLLSSQVVESPHRFVERLPVRPGACGRLAQGLVDQPLDVGGEACRAGSRGSPFDVPRFEPVLELGGGHPDGRLRAGPEPDGWKLAVPNPAANGRCREVEPLGGLPDRQ